MNENTPASAMASIVDAIFAAMQEANVAHNTVLRVAEPFPDQFGPGQHDSLDPEVCGCGTCTDRRDRAMGWLPLEECGGHYFEGEMGS